jgi:dihydroorotate dehydrogenase (NAD+) catalytic subunit
MLNAIGLANVGVDSFVTEKMPFLAKQKTIIVVNVAGWSVEDYTMVCERLNDLPRVDMVELNFSCPNVENGMEFSSDASQMERAVREVRKVFSRPIIAKLSPNVTNIVEIAKGAEQGGAHAVSLINSLVGMAIDLESWRPRLTNNTGGLTGPAVKPIALAMVNKVYNHCKLPIIGIGGIRTGEDVVEFLLCGASAVQIGTTLFLEPNAPVTIAKELSDYMKTKKIASISEIIGKVVRY